MDDDSETNELKMTEHDAVVPSPVADQAIAALLAQAIEQLQSDVAELQAMVRTFDKDVEGSFLDEEEQLRDFQLACEEFKRLTES